MRRGLFILLIILLLALQASLWQGTGSLREVTRLRQAIRQQNEEINRLSARNRQLAAEVKSLKTNPIALEERARTELGMIGEGETFCLVIEPMR